MNSSTHEQPRIVAAAERQMQSWVRSEQSQQRAVRRSDRPQRGLHFGPFLAISREAGAGASLVAQRVGREMGWQVMDRNVLDQLAETMHTSRPVLELVDETHSSLISGILDAMVDQAAISPEKYVMHLGRMILAAARRGNVVFVGRGASYVLPHSGGLAVRIVAPDDFRIRRIMQRENVDEAEARRRMEKVDRGRREFVQRYFHRDIADPRQYDLVLNTGRLGIEVVSDLLLVAMRSFQPSGYKA